MDNEEVFQANRFPRRLVRKALMCTSPPRAPLGEDDGPDDGPNYYVFLISEV